MLSGRVALPGSHLLLWVLVWEGGSLRLKCRLQSPAPPLISSSLPAKQLENVSWQRDGCLIATCHSDGSHCQWPVSSDTQNPEPLRSSMPYGQCFCVKGLTFFCLRSTCGLSWSRVWAASLIEAESGSREVQGLVQSRTAGCLVPTVAASGNCTERYLLPIAD